MTETDFTAEWLDTRYSFDSKARNQQVEAAFKNYFFGRKEIQLMDVGAGTGNNLRYWFRQLESPQKWTNVELNPELLALGFQQAAQLLTTEGYGVKQFENHISGMKRKNGRFHEVRLLALQESFLDFAFEILPVKPDVVLANAVFDLLSPEMFVAFAEKLIEHRIPLLSTINIAGLEWSTATFQDKYYSRCYLHHMNRPQAFGMALGAHVTDFAIDFCKKHQVNVEWGRSDWQIAETDTAMLLANLNYMEQAIPEMLPEAEHSAFSEWLSDKRKQVEAQKLRLNVYHYDWFVYF